MLFRSHLRSMLAALAETECLPKDWWQCTEDALTGLSYIFAQAAELRREQESISVEVRAAFDGDLEDLAALVSPFHERFDRWLRFLKLRTGRG